MTTFSKLFGGVSKKEITRTNVQNRNTKQGRQDLSGRLDFARLEDRTMMAISVVSDIVTTPNSSYIEEVVEIPGATGGMVASAITSEGWELVSIDSSGNQTVHSELYQDLAPTELVHFRDAQGQDWVYFNGRKDFSDRELYRLKWGTNEVSQVKNINPLGSSDPKDLTVVGNKIFFTAWNPASGRELYKTDGTGSGTVLVEDIRNGLGVSSNPTELTTFDSLLFFSADNGVGGRELWISGGTANTTFQVHDIYPGTGSSNPRELTVAGDQIYFSAFNPTSGREVWKSNGLSTSLLKNLQTAQFSSNPEQLTAWNNKLMFTADVNGTGRELYWYEPSVFNDTLLIKDIFAGTEGSNPQDLTIMNDQLYFSANSPNGGRELWKSNGFFAGTQLLKDLNPSGSSSPHSFLAVGNRLYFAATHSTLGTELYKTDGTSATTQMVANLFTNGSSDPELLTKMNGLAVFVADNGKDGNRELWTCGGNASTTKLVDLFPGTENSSPFGMTQLGNDVYFFARNTHQGTVKLYRSSGGTVSEIATSDATFDLNLGKLEVMGDQLYILKPRVAGEGFQLLKYDPASGNTSMLKEITGTFHDGVRPRTLISGGILYAFLSEPNGNFQIWKSNGTSGGTSRLKSGTTFASMSSMTDVNGRLYFTAMVGGVLQLWRSEGTNGNTTAIPNLSSPSGLMAKGDQIYFSASNGTSTNFYRINGTNAPVIILSNMEVDQGINANGTLYFSANNYSAPGTGYQLWKSTGTAASTSLVKAINDNGSSFPSEFKLAGGKVFFTAHTTALGRELYVTDGTSTGTKMLKNIGPTTTNANIVPLATFNNEFYFKAFDGTKYAIWKSNGTTAGTIKATALNDRFTNTANWDNNLLAIGTSLYISAVDDLFGHELFKYQI